MPRWQIFVTFHQGIHPEYYMEDPSFNPRYFTFLKLNPKFKSEYDPKWGFNVVQEIAIPGYDPYYQKMCYYSRSALYHMFKSGAYKKYDFIGFLEYDFRLQARAGHPKEVTSFIDQSLKGEVCVPLGFSHTTGDLYRQNLRLNRKNCMEQIVLDYNDFF